MGAIMGCLRRIGAGGPVPMVALSRAFDNEPIEIDPWTVVSVHVDTASLTAIRHRTITSANPEPTKDSVVLVVEVIGSVLQKIREALAEAPDASDEVRLAAGWVQEFRRLDDSMVWRYQRVEGRPAPLPAGGWRHLGNGLSMRWALPKKEKQA